MHKPVGLYIHIPFCRAKCRYCDFNSYAGMGDLFVPYARALVTHMESCGPRQVRTVYVGGGTPTLLPASLLTQVFDGARRAFRVEPGAEISIEANPGTISPGVLTALRALGVTRLSLGVQSLDDGELHMLGRIHTASEAVAAFRLGRAAGLAVNLDLIYGLPGQDVAGWQATLTRALDLAPDHLSLYALTLETGTPLADDIAAGRLPEPDPDVAADQYELAEDMLAAAGYAHYEISNWARPGFECRHNLIYWRNEPYLGIGAGAHSRDGHRRRAWVASPARYIKQVQAGASPADREAEVRIDRPGEMGETMMLGLRLLDEGVAYDRFERRFGLDLRRHYAKELADLEARGLIVAGPDRVTLSPRGRLLGNQVFMEFLP